MLTGWRCDLQPRQKPLANEVRAANCDEGKVPKKSKSNSESGVAAGADSTSAQPSAMSPGEVRKAAKPAKPRTAKSAAPRKKPAAKQQRMKPSAPAPIRREPTDDEIRIRAYFIAERRMQMGIPGNDTDDWLEARRQLEEEERDVAS